MAKLDEEKSAILNNQSLIAEVGTTMIIVIIKIFLLPCVHGCNGVRRYEKQDG